MTHALQTRLRNSAAFSAFYDFFDAYKIAIARIRIPQTIAIYCYVTTINACELGQPED